MIAASDVVPDLWENAGDWVHWVDHLDRISETGASVYACWRRKETRPPHIHFCLMSGPFSLGLSLLPDKARALAVQLVTAAELAEATQAALDAEHQGANHAV